MNEVPAGWYPDPYGVPNLLRWWDGAQWSGETAPTQPSWDQQWPDQGGAGEQPSGGYDPGFPATETSWPAAEQPGGGWPAPEQPSEPTTADFGQAPQWPSPEQPGGQEPTTQTSWPVPEQELGTQWPGQDPPAQQPAPAGGAPAVPTPWEGPQQPPGIEWEPQAEPPPFDEQFGLPGADWEPPTGVTPWGAAHGTEQQHAQEPSPAEPSTFEWANQQQQESSPFAPQQPQWQPEPSEQPEQYEQYSDYGQEPKRGRKGLLVGGIAGGLALILILGVVGGFLFINRDDDPVTQPSNSATPSAKRSSNQPSTTAPAGPRVAAGGISYTQLGDAWGGPAKTGVEELEPNKGQVQITQKDLPSSLGDWVAQVCVGTLTSKVKYSGPGDLESATTALADAVQEKYYTPLKTKREDVQKKKIEVSGKQGYEMRFHLAFVDPPDGFAAKGETVYVAVVDNDPKPAGVYVTIPDNKPELKPVIDDVVTSLQVGS